MRKGCGFYLESLLYSRRVSLCSDVITKDMYINFKYMRQIKCNNVYLKLLLVVS